MVSTRWLTTKREGSFGSYDRGQRLSTAKRKQIATDGQKSAVESTYGLRTQSAGGRTLSEARKWQVAPVQADLERKSGFGGILGTRRPRSALLFGPQGAGASGYFARRGLALTRNKPESDRRKWVRLPLAIPVFVRSKDGDGKELLEFATALNVSAGGILVAVRRSLPLSSQVLLEIPSAPLVPRADLPKSSRNLRARAIWITHAEGHQLVGLKFSHPLLNGNADGQPRRRKVVSSV